jgi:RND family efflux transporter MFP subunit
MDTSKLDTAQNAITQAGLGVERANQALESARLGIQTAEVRVKEASTNRDLAKARLVELKAATASLKVQLKKTRLKAPISGRIEKHLIEPGEFTGAGDPLAHIYDLRFIRAIVNVPDRYIAFLDAKNPTIRTFIQMNMPHAEQRIRAQLILLGLPKLTGENGAGIAFDAEIARIAQAADPSSNTYQVELRLPNPGGALRHGMIARGKIEYLYYPQAIVIPVKSVQVTDEGPRVLVVKAEKGVQRVHVREIEPISIRKDQLLIGRGLAQGDRLIITGWKGLVAGETVNVLLENGLFTDRSLNPG